MGRAPNVSEVVFDGDEMNKFMLCIARNTGVGVREAPLGIYIEYEDVNGKVYRVPVDRDSAHIDPDTGDVVAIVKKFQPQWDIDRAWIVLQCRNEFHRIAEMRPPNGSPLFEKGKVYDFELHVTFKPLPEAEG